MGVEDVVVGLWQAVALWRSDHCQKDSLGQPLLDRERDPGVGQLLVHRASQDVLGDDPGAPARRQEGLLRAVARLDRDVHRRVAHPQHEHPLAPERFGVDVVVRVHHLA